MTFDPFELGSLDAVVCLASDDGIALLRLVTSPLDKFDLIYFLVFGFLW